MNQEESASDEEHAKSKQKNIIQILKESEEIDFSSRGNILSQRELRLSGSQRDTK